MTTGPRFYKRKRFAWGREKWRKSSKNGQGNLGRLDGGYGDDDLHLGEALGSSIEQGNLKIETR